MSGSVPSPLLRGWGWKDGHKKSFAHRGGAKLLGFRSANTLYRGGRRMGIIMDIMLCEVWKFIEIHLEPEYRGNFIKGKPLLSFLLFFLL